MSMIFCRGCGKEIHESAPACPHCGAPQTALAAEGSDKFFDLCMQPLRRYATFTGRARRKEYWYFVLVYALAGSVLSAIEPALYGLFAAAFLLPMIAVGVRRMHDTDRSGWWLIVPIVGFVFTCFEGQQGPNRFGASPK